MSAVNRKGPLLESEMCRCCGQTKRCRILNVEYEWQGQKEVYSDIFVDCFGLLLSHLDGDPDERGICATCVTRLREAQAFRRQVLECEEKLLSTRIQLHNSDERINTEQELKPEIDLKVELEISKPTESTEVKPDDTVYSLDLDDNVDYDDAASIKSEPPPEKHKVKKKKTLKLSKLKKSLKRELKKKALKAVRHSYELAIEAPPPSQKREKILEEDQKIFHNIVTIVENSYVCPFTSSFSDYYCIYCKNTFLDPDKLREHTIQHDPLTFRKVYDGKKLAQIDILKINCRLCSKEITDIDTLKEHLVKTHGKDFHPIKNEFLKFKLSLNKITCIECGGLFKFFHALKKHMAEHFGSWICDKCGAHYFEERILIIHQKSHQKSEDDVFSCKECGKTFKSRHNRYLHEAKVHKKEAAYPCSKCDEVLFTYALRYRHMIEVHGLERVFSCDNCDRVYDSRKSLREHVRRSHLKIMKHECELCDRRFYLPSRLKEHMSTHTGERNFRCEYCGKSFPRLRGLKVHMQSHSTDKKYSCVLCNASFTQNVHLKNHFKKQHQGDVRGDVDDVFNTVV